MGPLLFTGLACFGGSIAAGLIAAGTPRSARETPEAAAMRGLAIVVMAVSQGIAILGVVVGLLAIFLVGISDPTSGLLAAVPAVVGAGFGLALIARRSGEADGSVSRIASFYIVGLAMLGIVVALLAVFIEDIGGAGPDDWPFVVLGLISCAAAIAIGQSGAGTIPKLQGADEPTIQALRRGQLSRLLPWQLVGVGSAAIAILLLVTA